MIASALFLLYAQTSGTTASFRGISAVTSQVAWASGTKGTYAITVDGGGKWKVGQVPGTEDLDFRDVQAFDERTAYLMSAGEGDKSRIYKTIDGGAHWMLLLTNSDPEGFFDAIACWDAKHGMVIGDPVDRRFAIYTTNDGQTWRHRPGPASLANEGAFAASGTCLVVMGKSEAWFGTGAARVFHSRNGGGSWNAAQTPLRHDGKGAGVFSLAFRDAQHGLAAGGDYTKPTEDTHNFAITNDGGRTWREPVKDRPRGYRSAVVFVPGTSIAVVTGTSGSEQSQDGGRSWKPLDTQGFNALAFVTNTGWAVGAEGRISRIDITHPVIKRKPAGHGPAVQPK